MSATSTGSDQDSRRQRNWRGSETGFPQATEMDCEEYGWQSSAFRDPRKAFAGASRAQY
jgi:hypothetical protein